MEAIMAQMVVNQLVEVRKSGFFLEFFGYITPGGEIHRQCRPVEDGVSRDAGALQSEPFPNSVLEAARRPGSIPLSCPDLRISKISGLIRPIPVRQCDTAICSHDLQLRLQIRHEATVPGKKIITRVSPLGVQMHLGEGHVVRVMVPLQLRGSLRVKAEVVGILYFTLGLHQGAKQRTKLRKFRITPVVDLPSLPQLKPKYLGIPVAGVGSTMVCGAVRLMGARGAAVPEEVMRSLMAIDHELLLVHSQRGGSKP
mmetsp:Transcript_56464/g.123736  ORF Transcript_56464/g.123736 Transcript_56464/m.123736 type:complete len:255 (-) Transcript_56464:108-872(-)